MGKKLRKRALVTVRKRFMTELGSQPFAEDLPLVFLGEIANMPDHGVFIGHKSGRIYSGFHVFQFRELRPDET
jgi:hypothetical protein